jgi:hypothetical protein
MGKRINANAKEALMSYNGHKTWNHWNVSLWINNDEGLYNLARGFVRQYGAKEGAQRLFDHHLAGQKTPDGAPYRISYVRAALVGILS